jgi:hypothetical protein
MNEMLRIVVVVPDLAAVEDAAKAERSLRIGLPALQQALKCGSHCSSGVPELRRSIGTHPDGVNPHELSRKSHKSSVTMTA